MHKVLVLAQGNNRRWTNPTKRYGELFLNTPKHLIKIDGETIVGRSRRLFEEAGCEAVVIGPQDERYGNTVTLKNPFPTGTEMDKLLATVELWSQDSRTIIAWGDCYYTEEAAKTIVEHKDDDLHYFRRPGPSSATGHRWDESFAVSFGPQDHQRVIDVAKKVVAAVKTGRISRDHIRTHYACHLGIGNIDSVAALQNTKGQTIIDDWSDDFDKPEEFVSWIGKRYVGVLPVVAVACYRVTDKHREISRQFVEKHYTDAGFTIYYGTHDGDIFNRAAAFPLTSAIAR